MRPQLNYDSVLCITFPNYHSQQSQSASERYDKFVSWEKTSTAMSHHIRWTSFEPFFMFCFAFFCFCCWKRFNQRDIANQTKTTKCGRCSRMFINGPIRLYHEVNWLYVLHHVHIACVESSPIRSRSLKVKNENLIGNKNGSKTSPESSRWNEFCRHSQQIHLLMRDCIILTSLLRWLLVTNSRFIGWRNGSFVKHRFCARLLWNHCCEKNRIISDTPKCSLKLGNWILIYKSVGLLFSAYRWVFCTSFSRISNYTLSFPIRERLSRT